MLIDGLHGFRLFKCAMTKEKLIETIQKILTADLDLSFLLKLSESELETLVTSIRAWVDQVPDCVGKL